MRHYFGYTADGTLAHKISHVGGFPTDCDISNPSCTHPLSVHVRSIQDGINNDPEDPTVIVGVALYDCPCADGLLDPCPHVAEKYRDSYWDFDTSSLVDKADVDVIIDGKITASGSTITKYPTQLFTVKVSAKVPSEVADGDIVYVTCRMMLENFYTQTTFTNGVSSDVALRAPSQGLIDTMHITGPHIKKKTFSVKGFAKI